MCFRSNLELSQEYKLKLAEFIGILLGDGCLSHYSYNWNNRSKNHYRVKITLNSIDDLDYVDYIANLCNHLFNIEPRICFRKNINAVDILIFNKSILNFLVNEIGLQLSPKWNRAIIPDQFCNNQLGRNVLRGYFDTDGCITIMNNNGIKYPRLEMKISPSPMQMQFINILKENNLDSKYIHWIKEKLLYIFVELMN